MLISSMTSYSLKTILQRPCRSIQICLLHLSITFGLRTSTPTNELRFFTAVNHNYGDNWLTKKIQKPTNGSKSANHSARNNLLTLLSKTFLFSKRSAAVIDGSEKRNGWLNFERQSPHVIERRSKAIFSGMTFHNQNVS